MPIGIKAFYLIPMLWSQARNRVTLRQSPEPSACFFLHLVDLALIHHYTDTQQEGEHQLVLLKEAAADIAVEAVG